MSRLPVRVALALSALLLLPVSASSDPRPRDPMNVAEIQLGIRRLGVYGSALYVGAHPDDENTALLAYLSQGRLVRATYLSLTRGDGGQNLVGPDIGERLGVIRTQELLAARRIDGAEQRFTRALDFGFSKNSDETLRKWGHDRILEDVVWVIRRLRPDVIITRFPPDSTAGHGHHAASAILAAEAFRAAGDSTQFPGQLQWLRPWQAKRLVWNVFRFGAAGPDNTPGRITIDLGEYNPALGRSYTEIAGLSRSMHKSQGFGAAERRGPLTNTFVVRDGEAATQDLFEGVDLTWSRVPGGSRVASRVADALKEWDPQHPAAVIPALVRVHGSLAAMPATDPIVQDRRAEVVELIRSCAGLWLEAIASVPEVSPGASLRVAALALARAKTPLAIERVELVRPGFQAAVLEEHNWGERPFGANVAEADTFQLATPLDLELTQPYWLRHVSTGAWNEVADPIIVGTPENFPALAVRYWLTANGEHFQASVPVTYRWVDPVAGERYRALDVVPPVSLALDRDVFLFPDRAARPVDVTVKSGDTRVAGNLKLELPEGWSATPASMPMIRNPGQPDTVARFQVRPPAGASTGTLLAYLEDASGRRYSRQLVRLDYPHIPMQTLIPQAEARLVRADLQARGREVGYVMGSGDPIPGALEQMGFHVTRLDDRDLERGDLSRYPVIVIGVRAYNTRPRLLAAQPRLLDWVAKGGRLVVQYQTPDNALEPKLGPVPFHISRDRVTVEDAPVTFLDPAHPLLKAPNRITADDFTGWVQERGLWFADRWDKAYQTPLSCHDPGEPARNGGTLYLKHGRGVFIYTGYAWFRQLPAGVAGAWRLFANLVSTGS